MLVKITIFKGFCHNFPKYWNSEKKKLMRLLEKAESLRKELASVTK